MKDEPQIIADVLAGNTDAFAILVRRYQKKVWSLCHSLLKNPTDAEDAAQESFVKAFEQLKKFRSESSFSTWLYRICYHHCLDQLKSKRHRMTDSLDDLIASKGEAAAGLGVLDEPMHEATPLLEGLSPDYKRILLLREVDGFSYDEIAELTQTSLDSVKARLRRARQALEKKARHFLSGTSV